MSQRFVGRQRDLEGVRQLLAGEARLVTLRGAPGLGKSRLASELLAAVATVFGERIAVCNLESATTPAAATRLLLAALPSPSEDELGSDPAVAALRGFSAGERALVVLDNADGLCGCAPETIGDWHAQATELSFLVTSRARLRLAEEVSRELQPLTRTESSELFRDRAAQYRALPTTTDADEAVEQIAELLDGIPLALELAAARTTVLSLNSLRDRLTENLNILTARSPDRPVRHHSLRSAVEWSYQTLAPAHRDALADLSVFRGSFELEEAEAVLAPGAGEVIDLLQELVDRSLVGTLVKDARVRYRIYRPIRSVAAEQLRGSERGAEVNSRHAQHFATLALRLGAQYQSPDATSALEALDSAFDDIHAAHLTLRTRDPELAARVALVLLQPIRARGLHRHYLEIFDAAVACATGGGDDELLARAHFARGLTLLGSNRGRAFDDFDRTRSLAEAIGNEKLLADALVGMGAVSFADQKRWREAEESWLEARQLYQSSGHRMGLANATANLAIAALDAGDLERAQAYVDESIAIYDREGLSHRLSFPVLISAAVAQERGELDAARELCAQAAQLATDLHHHRGRTAEALVQLASVECEAEQYTRARELCTQATDAYRAIEGFDAMASALIVGAVAAALDGDGAAAETLLAEARPHLGAYRARDGRDLFALGRTIVTRCDAASTQTPETVTAPETATVEELGQLARSVRRLLTKLEPVASVSSRSALRIGPSARWFQRDEDKPVSLGRRMLLRRLVVHLATRRAEAPGQPATVQELLDVGWPDEVIESSAASNRLYVAIAKLRRLGLAGVLVTRFEGYLFDPETIVELDTSEDPPAKP